MYQMKVGCVESQFVLEIRFFLTDNAIFFKMVDSSFLLSEFSITIVPLPLGRKIDEFDAMNNGSEKGERVVIHEDLWVQKGALIRNRLLARLGKGEVLFARKCSVREIETMAARDFLEENHILGYSRAKYKYGLFNGDKMVAVATFSASRPMMRDHGLVESFEWVRYASSGSLRIIGGMGKLLSFFARCVKPQEVMSYADAEWSEGGAYLSLGFEIAGKTTPVGFYVDKISYERFPMKKLLKDKKYRNQELDEDSAALLFNSGNFKFIRSFSFL